MVKVVILSALSVVSALTGLAAGALSAPPKNPLTLTVDDNAVNDPGPGQMALSDPWENGTASRPFDSIQEAIGAAVEGASIRVLPGVYHENIDLLGKRIRLIGLDPGDRTGNPYPVIVGVGAGPAVRFTQGEDPNCTLTGFVLTPGTGPGSAILCRAGSPTISHCLIVGCRITDSKGSAVVCTDSSAVFLNCTISDNLCGAQGAAMTLVNSPVMLSNSIVWGNAPTSLQVQGMAQPVIRYSDIAGEWPGQGNVDEDPRFTRRGTWSAPNDPLREVGPNHPGAIWVQGDYHLRSRAGRWDPSVQYWVLDDVSSACIDAGDPCTGPGYEPVPNGDIVNMGAYGGTAQASRSYVTDRPVHFGNPVLKAAVERTLGISNPTPAHMLKLTSLSTNYGYIDDLTGLEHALILQELNLMHNRITDLSPLSGLAHLRDLDLSDNYVLSDLSGLSGLSHLESLDVHRNAIWDLGPLWGLTCLRKLIARNNYIYEIGPLGSLTHLEELNIGNIVDSRRQMNAIVDISALTGLMHLRILDLQNLPLAGDAYLADLQTIMDNNPGIWIYADSSP